MNDWKTVRLGDVCEQIRGVSYKPADLHNELDDNSVILLRANNIFGDALNYDELVYVDNKKVFDSQYLKKGDILICASSGSKNLVGKAACLEEDRKLTFGAFCKVLRTDSVNHGFFKHYFFSPSYRSTISSLSAGANINNIRAEDLDNLLIPLPPLEEQKHIAAVLDKCTALIAKHKRMLEKYDTLVKSRFIEMFGDPATNPKGWKIIKLADSVITLPQNGMYKPQSDYVNNLSGTPILRIDGFYEGKISDWGSLKRLTCSNDDIKKYHLNEGDIVINRVNSIEYLGKCAHIQGLKETTVYESNMMRMHFDDNRFNPVYVTKLLCSNFIYGQILNHAKKAVNQASINQKDVLDFDLYLPPLPLQNDFATFVQQIDKSKFAVQKSLEKAETLYKSLMQKYFN